MLGSPKKEDKTQQEIALEARQRSLLDDEIEESERRFKRLGSSRGVRRSFLKQHPNVIAKPKSLIGHERQGAIGR